MPICNINEFLNKKYTKPKYMCLDIGKKKYGVAFSDPSLSFSLPHKVLIKKKNLDNEIVDIIINHEISAIIIGLPLNDDGSKNKKCQSIRDVTIELNKNFLGKDISIDIIFWDESYSSNVALEKMQHISRKNSKKFVIDKFAACIILQDFLDYIKIIKNAKN